MIKNGPSDFVVDLPRNPDSGGIPQKIQQHILLIHDKPGWTLKMRGRVDLRQFR